MIPETIQVAVQLTHVSPIVKILMRLQQVVSHVQRLALRLKEITTPTIQTCKTKHTGAMFKRILILGYLKTTRTHAPHIYRVISNASWTRHS
jgi:hypothetical protein